MNLRPVAAAVASFAVAVALGACGTTTIIVQAPPAPAAAAVVATAAPTPAPAITTLCAGQWSSQGTSGTFPVQVSISGPGETCASLTPKYQQDGTPDALAPITSAHWNTGSLALICSTTVPGTQVSVWAPNIPDPNAPGYTISRGANDICATQLQPIETEACYKAGGAPLFDSGGAAECDQLPAACLTNSVAVPGPQGYPVCKAPFSPCLKSWQFKTDGTVDLTMDRNMNTELTNHCPASG